MSQSYLYHITADFPNHIVSADRLSKEIRDSVITIALDRIDTTGDDCAVWFKAALSVSEESTLDAIVAAHSGAPIPSPNVTQIMGDLNIPVPQNSMGFIKQISELREGSEAIYTSHNFCDKCTWFGDSVRSENETLVDSGDHQTYAGAHAYWIDMVSGRIQDDDGLVEEQQELNPSNPHGYQVTVKVNNVVKQMREPLETSGGDYEVIWEEGKVFFFNALAPTDVVEASYSYAAGSTFYLKALPGKTLRVEAAEADFSSDVVVTDGIYYKVYGYVDKIPQTSQYAYFIATGTVNFTNGGLTVTGTGTTFLTQVLQGTYVRAENAPPEHYMVVASVDSNTQITLAAPYAGVTGSGVTLAYAQAPTGVIPAGTQIPLTGTKYKRITNIFQEAIGAYPYIAATGTTSQERAMGVAEFRRKSRGTLNDIQAIPFRYATVRDLAYDAGLEVRVYLGHDRAWGGETATLTFYCTSLPY